MASGKGRLLRLFSEIALKRGTVSAAEDVGGFRRLLVRSDVSAIAAGTKVQLLLPSDDVRTYTPVRSRDGMTLLGWKHAGGPGAGWMTSARVGDEVLFVGPQRSLELDAGPLLIVGDETSVAVAAAFALERKDEVHAIIQATAPDDVRMAARTIGLDRLDAVAPGDHAATADAVRAKMKSGRYRVALTGGSDLVVGVRAALRNAGADAIKTKTYWVPGKTGLD